MSDRRRGEKNEKEEEKRRRDEEKRTEKEHGEKWTRDPVRTIMFAAILIWGGIVAFLDTVVDVSWWKGWSIFLIGTGVILLIKAAFRQMPQYRRPIGGTVIIAIILLGVGIGDIVGWNYAWPVILIVVGLALILWMVVRRR